MIDASKVPKQLEDALGLCVVAVAKDSITGASGETGHIASLRYTVKGTRTVFTAPYASVIGFMMKKDRVSGSGTPTPDMVYSYLKDLSAEQMQELQQACSNVYQGTVGPGDAILLPSNWAFIERVTTGGDCIGLKIQFLGKVHIDEMVKANTVLVAARQPDPMLTAAIDCLALL